jgi:hypothetical protein
MNGSLGLVYPVLAQVLLTLILFFQLAIARAAVLRTRQVRFRDVALSGDAWPEDARKVGNNVRNQFETPVLFYVLCGVATYIGATGSFMALLAWIYVATRVVHAAIHTTYNRVQHRFLPFVVGFLALVLMWVVIVLRLVAS